MEKYLNLKRSVYDLCLNDATIRSVLIELGLRAVASPKSLSAYRNKTLADIVPIRGNGLDEIIKIFEDKGYMIIGRDSQENVHE